MENIQELTQTVIAILGAEQGRTLELVRLMARTHPTAEGRTAARLEMARLEREQQVSR